MLMLLSHVWLSNTVATLKGTSLGKLKILPQKYFTVNYIQCKHTKE